MIPFMPCPTFQRYVPMYSGILIGASLSRFHEAPALIDLALLLSYRNIYENQLFSLRAVIAYNSISYLQTPSLPKFIISLLHRRQYGRRVDSTLIWISGEESA